MYKYDYNKLDISLVPSQIILEIARVRQYGVKKYGSVDSWMHIENKRYYKAMLRHVLAIMRDGDIYCLDDGSGLPHLAHIACNIAFMLEDWKGGVGV